MKNYTFTSESVSEGHPDKICDRISDTLLDAFLQRDPEARTAIETVATTNRVILVGEVSSEFSPLPDEIEDLIRMTVKEIGYEQDGFHWKNLKIENYLHAQSPDIAMGVKASATKDEGAGDQGIMFGYACSDTKALMPAPLYYAHKILRHLSEGRARGDFPTLGPDSKSQISIKYENDKPMGCTAIVLSTQHDASLTQDDVRAIVTPVIESVLPKGWMCPLDKLYVNPTGRFVIGGPDGDAGLTGRKIIVDTYGGASAHGGGAFSGKDPSKVDRSAAYMARYIAKNIVAAGLAEKCVLQLSYAIGRADPTSLYLNTFETGKVDEEKLLRILPELVNLTPRGIRTHLNLNRPIYARTAAYGHFGRTPDEDGGFSWETCDLVNELTSYFGHSVKYA
ncbi:S-adenosylmethionine synthase [Candidatus Bealeia paramacronuclearis]|uniref:S-adenosylmethionine synthase n=2 Tax=Candidatus Bealeia paramacronuclearis TaxID=1921001 RepID=A0ABZ2C1D5_9PROT|nr:S-adenosylmethionine synthase [Candidatus Bealeia paramacronuclearis]